MGIEASVLLGAGVLGTSGRVQSLVEVFQSMVFVTAAHAD